MLQQKFEIPSLDSSMLERDTREEEHHLPTITTEIATIPFPWDHPKMRDPKADVARKISYCGKVVMGHQDLKDKMEVHSIQAKNLIWMKRLRIQADPWKHIWLKSTVVSHSTGKHGENTGPIPFSVTLTIHFIMGENNLLQWYYALAYTIRQLVAASMKVLW